MRQPTGCPCGVYQDQEGTIVKVVELLVVLVVNNNDNKQHQVWNPWGLANVDERCYPQLGGPLQSGVLFLLVN